MCQSVKQMLQQVEQIMRRHQLWQVIPPEKLASKSEQPFSLDTLQPLEWLQWVFIPQMYHYLDHAIELPGKVHITPYFDVTLHKSLAGRAVLLACLQQLDALFAASATSAPTNQQVHTLE